MGQCLGYAGRETRFRWGPAGEAVEVLGSGGVESQGAGQGGQDLRGGRDVAALFEPGVPGDAHIGQKGDLFPAQAGCPPSAAGGEPDLLGSQSGPSRAQEVRQRGPS